MNGVRTGLVGLVCALLGVGACGADEGEGAAGAAGASETAAVAAASDSAAAVALLDALRERHRFMPPASGPSRPVQFQRDGTWLRPVQSVVGRPGAAGEKAWTLSLPARSTDAFHLRETESGVALTSRLRQARPADAEVAGDYLVYRGAGPSGGTVLHRIVDGGTEDYVTFDRAPAATEVRYEITLSDEVAGLRLVDRTLEALDASGTPRLRVAPPFLVDARGTAHDAALEVQGCAVDRSPAPPWDRAPTPPGGAVCELRVSWDGARVEYPAILDPSWTTTASMGAANTRWLATATVLTTNRVLVAGGQSSSNVSLRSAQLYDPSTRTWATTGNMAARRMQHAAVLLNSGRAMVSGGQDVGAFTVLRTVESYNATTGTWSTLASMADTRWGHTATVLSNGDVLVTGGTVGQIPQTRTERFRIASSTWAAAAPMLSGQQSHTATRLGNGNVLVVGRNGPAAQIFNATNNTWTATAGMAVPRYMHTATLLANGTVLIAGGLDNQFGSTRVAEIFNPTGATWTRTGETTYAHVSATATRFTSGNLNGRVVLVGDPFATQATATEIFNPTWGTWAFGPSVVTPRSGHVAALLSTGRILIAGGATATTPSTTIASAEEFIPTTTATTSPEYKLAAAIDDTVLAGIETERWAVVHRPATFTTGTRYPLLVFLHGAHPTCGTGTNPRTDNDCTYSGTGMCPTGWVPTPNHRGYDYIASEMASRGYIVVSINANRGIECNHGNEDYYLILARGNLVLRHLQTLSEWDRGVSTPPTGLTDIRNHINFSQVGLLGHSRGGEGVRAAYVQYRDAGSPWPGRIVTPVTFRGIFEIGPVDGLAPRVLNADNTNWSVLLPMCDGDVNDLAGMKVFDRMMGIFNESIPTFKSTYTVWGANHNYYNTEWQESENQTFCLDHRAMFTSGPGISGSAEQRQTGFVSAVSFFLGNVGPNANAAYDNLFDPKTRFQFDPPVDRGYTPAANSAQSLMLEDFTGATGTSSYGLPNLFFNISMGHGSIPEHDPGLRGASITWTSPGQDVYFQSTFTPFGQGLDLRAYQMLELRVDRARDLDLNTTPSTNFEVALANLDGTPSTSVFVGNYGQVLSGPVGGSRFAEDRYHSALQTVRIPLSDFTQVDLSKVGGVRLTFSYTPSGSIYVANIRATKVTTPPPLGPLAAPATFAAVASATLGPAPSTTQSFVTPTAPPPPPPHSSSGNAVVSIRSSADRASVLFDVSSQMRFLPQGEIMVMNIGPSAQAPLFSYPLGNLTRAVFKLPRADFDRLAGGEPITVQYGRRPSRSPTWEFGALDKSRLDR